MITITAFKWVPPFAQGLVRDLRARWALNEIGEPYEVRLLGMGEHKQPAHLAHQPFGQVPTYEEDGLSLFESGAMVLHIAEKKPGVLLPENPDARARAITWMFAALNSVEPYVQTAAMFDVFADGMQNKSQAKPALLDMVHDKLSKLSDHLGTRDYLEDGGFTAGDLLMSATLRIGPEFVTPYPNLAAYRERCEARPAFQKALADQLAPFEKYAPAAA